LKQVNTEDLINQLKKPQSEIIKERQESAAAAQKEIFEATGEGITRKQRKELLCDAAEKQERTLFLGNLPVACATDKTLIKSLKTRFSAYGQVESIRFRSIPFAEPQARRVAFIKKNFRKDGTGGTCNGYVVMDKREGALAALKENASIFAERHLRVDLAAEGDGSTKCNTKKSIFVGNLPMDLEEEPVWQLFGKCGSVTNVRLVRDRVTNMGKGIGYVTFASKDSVDLALKLAGTALGGRPVRVSPCSKIGMVEKKKVRASNLAEKREKRAAALVKANPGGDQEEIGKLGATKGSSVPPQFSKENNSSEPPVKVSKKDAKLQAELQTKFGQLFHKKFPFAQAISEVSKDPKDSETKRKDKTEKNYEKKSSIDQKKPYEKKSFDSSKKPYEKKSSFDSSKKSDEKKSSFESAKKTTTSSGSKKPSMKVEKPVKNLKEISSKQSKDLSTKRTPVKISMPSSHNRN